MGEVDEEFPIFQKEWNRTADFCTTAIQWMAMFFADRAKAEQKK
ncbi:MAG: hypothetical protein ACTMH4_07280 [Sphingobacterium sp.]|nr:hypothetical protein FM107_14155 [Sphingobacterium sp. JB170]